MKILLAKPRGFCAGVDYAIGIVEEALKLFDEPIYILKEIVHNQKIVQELASKGARSVNSIEEVPKGSILIFSAHGVPPEFFIEAKAKGLRVLDATCPLVRKVHLEAIKFAKQNYTILYIGHKGHDEAIGVLAEAPHCMFLINDKQDALTINPPQTEKMAYLTQTTLSLAETQEIINILKNRFPQIIAPPADDICYATTNRQLAVINLAQYCDVIFVIGSQNSSNSQRLRECAEKEGCTAFLIENKNFIQTNWLNFAKTIGITAGASAPEELVQETVQFLQSLEPNSQVQELEFVKEKMYFPLPKLVKKQ